MPDELVRPSYCGEGPNDPHGLPLPALREHQCVHSPQLNSREGLSTAPRGLPQPAAFPKVGPRPMVGVVRRDGYLEDEPGRAS